MHKNLHTNVYSDFQKLETTCTSLSQGWTNKLWATPTVEYYSEVKRNELQKHHNIMNDSQMH